MWDRDCTCEDMQIVGQKNEGRGWGEGKCERTAEGRDEANFHIIRRVKY
jgi:hypothetical protein